LIIEVLAVGPLAYARGTAMRGTAMRATATRGNAAPQGKAWNQITLP
jgi:hypothetical protein